MVEELEQRVLALEKRTSQPQAVAQKPADASGKIVAAPARPETAGAKYSKSARVAITLGEGEALSFLPREAGLTRFHSFEVVVRKLKKLLRLVRASKQH